MAPKKTILKNRQDRARKLKGVKLDFDKLPPPAIPIADRTNSSPTTKKRRLTFADASTSPINTVKPLSASDITTVATTPKEEMDIFADIDPMDITDADIPIRAGAALDLVDYFDPNEELLTDRNGLALFRQTRERMPRNFTSGRRQTLWFP